jgi:hypothetical protein
MSAVRFTRPLFAASVVGTAAVVAAVATLFSATPEIRRQVTAPTRVEAKSCDVLLCAWEELLPTTSTFSHSFGPPGLLSLDAFTDAIGYNASGGPAFIPRGFAFGLTKLNGNGGPPGLVVAEAAHNRGGNGGSATNPGGGSSSGAGGGGEVAVSVTPSSTPATGSVGTTDTDVPVTTNPEPATVALFATGLFVLIPVIRRQRRR